MRVSFLLTRSLLFVLIHALFPAMDAFAAPDTSSRFSMNSPDVVVILGLCLLIFAASEVLCVWLLRERHRMNRELRDIQNKYRVIADYSADLIWSTDEHLRLTFVSPSVEWVLGYSKEEFLNRSVRDICADSSQDAFDDFFTKDFCELSSMGRWHGEEYVELELVRKDGRRIWTETSRTSMCIPKEKLNGYVCVTREITLRKLAEYALQEEEGRFRTLAQHQVEPLLIVGEDGVVDYANPAAMELFNSEEFDILGEQFGYPLMADMSQEIEISASNGEDRVYALRVAPISWNHKPAYVVSLHDVTQRKHMEEALHESKERYRTVADHTYDYESWIAPDGRILYASPSCRRITGYVAERFASNTEFMERLLHEEDQELWREHMQVHSHKGHGNLDFRIRHADGRVRWICQTSNPVYNEDNIYLGIRCSMRDITARKLMEEQLQHQALHDPLTDVGNRTLCLDRIMQGLERSKRRDDYFYAVAFLGLDRFKLINESLGHAFGDKLLVEVSGRLLKSVRELDTVSRFGGDEFVLFLEELGSPREAVQIIKRVCERLRRPFEIDGRQVCITASLGVVLSPADYKKPADLLRNATIAMYRAKEAGRDRFKIFNSRMLESVVRQMHLENDLRRGIKEQEFYLEFQPVVHLAGGRLLGFEALLRWSHPRHGTVMPSTFIPLAEETGMIIELGRWVLEDSCRVMQRLMEDFPWAYNLFMSVNISGRQFSQPGLVDCVKRALQNSWIPAENLKLEITETTIMENAELATEKLHRLKELGVTLSIDDFGTGYSSLAYLQRFPLDNLKIDISFVRMMETSSENLEIVKAIIDLAHNLGLEVVAEGVENPLQRQTLGALGCEYAQGYLFSPPVSLEQARELVRELGDLHDDEEQVTA